MDKLEIYRQIIRQVLQSYLNISYANVNIHNRAAFDRGDKFANYRTINTLEEYVLINQERINVECFRRNTEGL